MFLSWPGPDSRARSPGLVSQRPPQQKALDGDPAAQSPDLSSAPRKVTPLRGRRSLASLGQAFVEGLVEHLLPQQKCVD